MRRGDHVCSTEGVRHGGRLVGQVCSWQTVAYIAATCPRDLSLAILITVPTRNRSLERVQLVFEDRLEFLLRLIFGQLPEAWAIIYNI
jgi:hypothetical protein